MKHIAYHNRTEKEALEYTSRLVDFGVTLIVYAALNEVLNAYIRLRQSKYFRGNIKRRAKDALKLRNWKVRELKDLVMHKGFAESYWDAVVDACEEDIGTFRREIRATLEDAHADYADLYAQAEVTRVLLEAAKIHYEEVIRDSTAKFRSQDMHGMRNLNLFDAFHEFYIDGIYREWNIVCDELYRNKSNDIDLTNERTISAFNAMADKFAKGLYIDDCLKAASTEYPEFSGAKIVIEKD